MCTTVQLELYQGKIMAAKGCLDLAGPLRHMRYSPSSPASWVTLLVVMVVLVVVLVWLVDAVAV